jgi:HSP20 family protein
MEGTTMRNMTIFHPMFPLLRVNPETFLTRVFDNNAVGSEPFRSPAVDVREEGGRFVIEAELPGLAETDVRIEVENGVLTMSADRKEEKQEEDDSRKWVRRERREFSFRRSFNLPDIADGEKIDARLKDGLLTIEIPKKPETTPRIVPVKTT